MSKDAATRAIEICARLGVTVPVVLLAFAGESSAAIPDTPGANAPRASAEALVSRNEVASRILASIRAGLTNPDDATDIKHINKHTNVITAPHTDIPHTNNPRNYCDENGRCEHMNIPHQNTPVQHDDIPHENRDDGT